MRRPAVLAFSLFAIAASLPAEVRECLPMTAACAHRAGRAETSCTKAAGPQAGSCRRVRPAACPKPVPTRESDDCRLHPTPPITLGAQPALPAPTDVVVLELPPQPEPGDAGGFGWRGWRGWREAPTLPPRASPASTPASPRPPPFTV